MTKKLVSFDDQAEPGEGLPAAVKAELKATYAPTTGVTAVVTEPRFGAKGDGTTDDTVAIQAAIDWASAQGGGEVIVPNGTYMIFAHVPGFTGNYLRDEGGVRMKNNVHLRLSTGTTLQAIPNVERQYNIVNSYMKSNVKISGGTIKGDRDQHLGTTGEWGYGIAILGGKNVSIEDVRCIDCWGDGINVQEPTRPSPLPAGYVAPVVENLTISRVLCSNNRRQGMSIEGVINLSVTDSIFELTGGIDTAPCAGVDIEPWFTDQPIRNMHFERCTFRNNQSSGMLIMKPQLDGLTVADCVFDGNTDSEAQLKTYSSGKGVRLIRNTFRNSSVDADAVRVQGTSVVVAEGNVSDGRLSFRSGPLENEVQALVRDLVVRDNIVTANLGGVNLFAVERALVSGNTLSSPFLAAEALVEVSGSYDVEVASNILIGGRRSLLVGERYTSRQSRHIRFHHNTCIDNNAAWIQHDNQVADFEVADNSVYGACHGNANGPAMIGGSSCRVLRNTAYRAPVNSSAGTGRAGVFVSIAAGAESSVVRDNRLVGEGATPYPLWNVSAAPVLTTGYVAAENALMAIETAKRPTAPTPGVQLFDTTLGKVITWSGTEWKDAAGVTV